MKGRISEIFLLNILIGSHTPLSQCSDTGNISIPIVTVRLSSV